MSRITKDLLLVGSIPLNTVEEVLTTCAKYVGDYVPGLTDGEVGDRRMWVAHLFSRYYKKHPDLEFSAKFKPRWIEHQEREIPVAMDDLTYLKLRPGVKKIRFEELGFARAAKESYPIFTRLRDQGAIPHDVRFQVCMPLTNSAIGWFFNVPGDYPILGAAVEETLGRELREVVEAIPARDLMIQLDVCWEMLDSQNCFHYAPAGDKLGYNSDPAGRLGLNEIPADVWLGYHMCYGTAGGWPMTKPKDFKLPVDYANALVAKTPRAVDYVHLPAARKAFDDAYYAPLEQLKVGNAKVYLGLIHDSEPDLTEFRKRRDLAKRHLAHFGHSSVCGYGRCSVEQFFHALDLHRGVMQEA